jgi:hypothetical protein
MYTTKFTKGKWVDKSHLSKDMTHIVRRIDTEDGTSICIVRTNNQEQAEANTLLISKAPEMLEMLEALISAFESENLELYQQIRIENAKQLIQEATEI